MDFFGIGMAEILLILVVGLIIWGPHRIVEIGKTLGKMSHSLRKSTEDLTRQVSKEIAEEERGHGTLRQNQADKRSVIKQGIENG